jgi:hypothetical protein
MRPKSDLLRALSVSCRDRRWLQQRVPEALEPKPILE